MQCRQCDADVEQVAGKRTRIYCDDKCRMAYARQHRTDPIPNTEQTNTEQAIPNTLIEQCIKRAAAGKSHRDGDPVWPYTRHLIPSDFVAWCRLNRPSWLTSAKPGDADYNWTESAVPRDNPAYGKVTV